MTFTVKYQRDDIQKTAAYDAYVQRLQNAHKMTGAQHDAQFKQQPSTAGLSPSEAYKIKVANAHKGK